MLTLRLRRREIVNDGAGHSVWRDVEERQRISPKRTALLLCDVWDSHWSRGAVERLEAMIPRMNVVVRNVREKGVVIIHAPSDTMDFYTDHPARKRLKGIPSVELPAPSDLPDPPLPIDDSDGGSDTGETPWRKAWTRQHPGIGIDPERDVISDDGREIYSYLQAQSVGRLLLMGVHTNMCVLGRPFAIKQMVRWGVPVALVRDLTDTMYNPAMSPYVSHEAGTELVIRYIESFWCPTLLSDDLLTDKEE